ncbi:MAG: bifunctional nuclease family protein [Elusimicrobia bacterium]|nr:bifunctional nuclease family protein [Elusimicrobiota bacterium]
MAKNGSGGPPDPAPPTPEKEVRIYSLATTANECIIFLEELTGNRLLPIWIGITEGQAIAIRFSGIVLPRPLTHDLLLGTITQLGYTVQKVVVCDIKDNTFYARVRVVNKEGQAADLDSRPSDAIAVAVRAGCPIFVEEKVFANCQTLSKPITEDEVSKFKADLKKEPKKGKKPSKEEPGPQGEGPGSEEEKDDE